MGLRRAQGGAAVVLACLVFIHTLGAARAGGGGPAAAPGKGQCSMFGVCGFRADGGALNCANATPAAKPSPQLSKDIQALCPALWDGAGGPAGAFCCSEEQFGILKSQVQQGVNFLLGCPACKNNFLHLFCTLACSPDQSLFTRVVATAPAASNNATAVTELDYLVSEGFGSGMYDSCKDVKFSAMNVKAMDFVGGGATSYQAWLDFLGLVKDKQPSHMGSPFQINFPPGPAPKGHAAMNDTAVGCAGGAFGCSCGDCPSAPGCAPPAPPPTPPPPGCPAVGMEGRGAPHCLDLGLGAAYLLLIVPLAYIAEKGAPSAVLRALGRRS
eukprot:CAMPEP_0182890200 /NCGR_PEP_ID=MMETSP0034_2-20130328/22509_1 /TAXON_ID=156128 /ORGANISM="Nephroselmis pyriformis, Strain CCMP717" /LENGTH=326 /DNA_ID=CAMNT_0025023735 /DNA_START=167 /DNA_END=1144 /DNA_ORIENTATION=+